MTELLNCIQHILGSATPPPLSAPTNSNWVYTASNTPGTQKWKLVVDPHPDRQTVVTVYQLDNTNPTREPLANCL
ncbi:hypothetical protein ACF08M_05835 [Streptomyces sp. NPDC015032]|uniref:hypothetical protein n=1 Tax=Streptomyces sp. NPDC015032 TaxID=3364937 RepID=UPI0036F7E31E